MFVHWGVCARTCARAYVCARARTPPQNTTASPDALAVKPSSYPGDEPAASGGASVPSQATAILLVMKLIVHVDGGARGNPGPAAAACVISDAAGETVDECAELLGQVTNNVAEYRALLLGLQRARALGASEIEVVNDSELIAKQVQGLYKVKHPAMRPLHNQALAALREFEQWSIRTVPRARNAHADALVNAALDQARAAAAG